MEWIRQAMGKAYKEGAVTETARAEIVRVRIELKNVCVLIVDSHGHTRQENHVGDSSVANVDLK
jgi:hypothetical protein